MSCELSCTLWRIPSKDAVCVVDETRNMALVQYGKRTGGEGCRTKFDIVANQ